MRRKRRALALADQTASHPFRRSLPSYASASGAGRFRWRVSACDVREFLTAYCAAFLAVSTFIF
jgi:hypothetical protein